MITFNYTDGQTCVATTTNAEHMKAVVDDFKTFLRHVGFHADNVDCVVYQDIHEERQALPEQLDWINRNYGGPKEDK